MLNHISVLRTERQSRQMILYSGMKQVRYTNFNDDLSVWDIYICGICVPESMSFFYENCNIPKLTSAQSEDCEKQLSLNELHRTLKLFNKNRAPGIDGLTCEFYLKFWDRLGPLLLDVYEESFESGILPENMRVGMITLLEKKRKSRLKIENWRPITLLGLDVKLLSKCLGERLK